MAVMKILSDQVTFRGKDFSRWPSVNNEDDATFAIKTVNNYKHPCEDG
jgi:hypothetical protein